MRVSTLQIFQQGIDNMLSKQRELVDTQEQIATGKRLLDASEDPAAAARVVEVSSQLAKIDQFQSNTTAATNQLGLEESALANFATELQRVRELTLQANNATLRSDDKRAISVEISQRLESLLDLANTRDAAGEYIFAGFQSQSQPFTRTPTGVTYSGDDGQRFTQVSSGTTIQTRDSGQAVFLSAKAGNGKFDYRATGTNSGTATVASAVATNTYTADTYTITFTKANPTDPITYAVTRTGGAQVATGNYTAGAAITFAGAELQIEGTPAHSDTIVVTSNAKQSIFTTVQDLVDSFSTATDTAASRALGNNEASRGLTNLDQALERILMKQAEVGVRMRRADDQVDINEHFNIQLQETLSDLQDLDYTEAITRLNMQMVALQAAQQSFAKIQGQNLFDYL